MIQPTGGSALRLHAEVVQRIRVDVIHRIGRQDDALPRRTVVRGPAQATRPARDPYFLVDRIVLYIERRALLWHNHIQCRQRRHAIDDGRVSGVVELRRPIAERLPSVFGKQKSSRGLHAAARRVVYESESNPHDILLDIDGKDPIRGTDERVGVCHKPRGASIRRQIQEGPDPERVAPCGKVRDAVAQDAVPGFEQTLKTGPRQNRLRMGLRGDAANDREQER